MRTKNNHHGQSMVEFALVLPLLLLLIIGAMDIGRLFYVKMVLTNAAREGANYMAFHPDDDDDDDFQELLDGTYEVIEAEGEIFSIEIVASEVGEKEVTIILEGVVSGEAKISIPPNGIPSLFKFESGDKVTVEITKELDLIFDGILQSLGLINGPITVSSSINMVVQ